MYKDLDVSKIADGVIFVSATEFMERFGVPHSSLFQLIHRDYIDAYRFRNRTFFLPEDVEKYAKLFNAGLMGRNRS
jgi:hypothetical protein